MGSISKSEMTSCPLAVVGIGMRLPDGIKTDSQFWDLLISKRCARCEVPENRFTIDGFHSVSGEKGSVCCRHGHFLAEDLARFDAEFFSIPASELAKMDPQQRLLLKVVWECMENAGQVGWQGGDVGCYVGAFGEDWLDLSNKDPQNLGKGRLSGTGDFALANRISYQFDLKGPSCTIRTACSSAMVGLDMAQRAIATGACSSAIVAGSNLVLTPTNTIAMTELGALSPEGLSKTFDASADGYARGEAINAIYVKKLEDAIRDGDPIRAVIRGTATNCDGKTVGMSTPSSKAQEELIRTAYRLAGISDPLQTAYIECHGTGTVIGDPAEAEAVAKVFGQEGIVMGAVKPNVGHVPFKAARLHVPTEVLSWPEDRLERVSVNAFSVGGVNAHAIVESPRSYLGDKKKESTNAQRRSYLHVTSADTMEPLKVRLHSMEEYLSRSSHSVKDIAYTLGSRREHLMCRGFIVSDHDGRPGVSEARKSYTKPPSLVFVFNGQGAQWPGMAAELLQTFPSFRRSIEKIDMALQSLEDAPSWTISDNLADANSGAWIGKAEFAQPLCTALQIGLVDLLAEWNIRPGVVVGHSSGEIAAAYAAGTLTAQEAIMVAYYRGKLTSSLQCEGAMAAVGMGPEEIQEFLVEGAIVACENSPKSVTISGDVDKVEMVGKAIQSKRPGTFYRRLQVSIAYHSHHMKAIGDTYETILNRHLRTWMPTVYSSVTPASSSPSRMDATYWRQNLESPVRFYSAVEAVLKDRQNRCFIEIGPHSTLAGPLRQIFAAGRYEPEPVYIPTLIRGKPQGASLMAAAGHIHTLGASVNFDALNGTGTVVTDLPLYPWQDNTVYWDEGRASKNWRFRQFPHHELLGSLLLEASELEPTWRNVLRLEDVPWLQDHRLGHDIVFPCAGYVAMVGEAIRRITGLPGYVVRRLYINSALLMRASAPCELMTGLRPARVTSALDSAWYEFTISTFENDRWSKHCTGLVRGDAPQESTAQPISSLPRRVESHTWYRALSNLGINYGPWFQGLNDITAYPTRGSAVATVDGNSKDWRSFYQIHPTAIDQSLQLLFLAKCAGIVRRLERPAVPKTIEEIQVGPGGERLTIQASVIPTDDGTIQGQVTATADGRPALQMQDCMFNYLDLDEREDDLAAVYMKWGPHIDLAHYQDLIQGMADRDSALLVEALVILCIPETLQRINAVEIGVPHLRLLREWLESHNALIARGEYDHIVDRARVWLTLDSNDRLALIEDMSSKIDKCQFASPGKAILSIFNNVDDLFKGDVQPLELLTESNLLTGIYDEVQERVQLEGFFSTMGHSKPTMKVLEIGAGTGGTTFTALKALVPPNSTRTYSDYTFTDVSPGFFAAAKERFRDYEQMQFQVLDITKDPLEQGFSPYSFDLIVASNVLHATPSLHSTLSNVRKLLAPGGKLFLQELSTDMIFMGYIMGTLPGWWVGDNDGRASKPFVSVQRWDEELRSAGFTGVESAIYDDDEPYQINAHIISSPAELEVTQCSVTLLYHSEIGQAANTIAERFIQDNYVVTWRKLGQDMPDGQLVISLLDLEGPFFDDISLVDWNAFVHYLSSSGFWGMLWVTKNCQIHCQDPRYALVLGTARTIRAELSVDFATLEVDNFAAHADSIVAVCGNLHRQRRRESNMIDYEYALVNDTVHVSRYFPFTPAEYRCNSTEGSDKELFIEKIGSLDSLAWMQSSRKVLADDQVEIRMQAVGLNFKDVLVAMGVVGGSKTTLGLEGSGTVTRTGFKVRRLNEGDRVIVIGIGRCCSTRMVAPERLCVRIPDNVSFEDAATMPCVFATAIHSLIDLAKLKPEETILIHSACGGVGQAAIQISQYIGATVYATVGSEEKARYLTENFGIPKDRIYNSRTTGFRDQLMQHTQGAGVNVVLNSLSGELLHASWRCVADFGTMVEIGKRDFLDYGMLSMTEFGANRAFFGIDLMPLVKSRPQQILSYLEQAMDLLQKGRLRPIQPINLFQAVDVKKAFRYMQSGQHIGKIVIQMPEDPKELSISLSSKQGPPLFCSESSYLLVGGLGGLGRAISTWMVENGARHLVYLSRSADSSARSRAFFRELEAQGCTVTPVTGTVADIADVRRAVDRSPRPISEVLHLSMVLQDRALLQMTLEDWKAATMPKVAGTWNLHHVFEHHQLDFFLLFSSLVGHQGYSGQANYAAGSTFLDAFTQYRRNLGLPASVIDVGVMDEVGYVSENAGAFQRLSSKGLHFLTERELLKAIQVVVSGQRAAKTAGRGLSNTISQLSIGMMSPRTPMSALAKDDVRMSVQRNLEMHSQTTQNSGNGPLKEFLSAVVADPDTLRDGSSLELVTSEVANMVCSIMSLRREDLDMSKSMTALGIDSLVSVEIRKWWRQSLGLEISVLEIGRMGSVKQLGAFALESLCQKYLGN